MGWFQVSDVFEAETGVELNSLSLENVDLLSDKLNKPLAVLSFTKMLRDTASTWDEGIVGVDGLGLLPLTEYRIITFICVDWYLVTHLVLDRDEGLVEL